MLTNASNKRVLMQVPPSGTSAMVFTVVTKISHGRKAGHFMISILTSISGFVYMIVSNFQDFSPSRVFRLHGLVTMRSFVVCRGVFQIPA